jgi:hypothetical protein
MVEGVNVSDAGTLRDDADLRRLLESAIASDVVQAEARRASLTDADLRDAISSEDAHAAAEREAVRRIASWLALNPQWRASSRPRGLDEASSPECSRGFWIKARGSLRSRRG